MHDSKNPELNLAKKKIASMSETSVYFYGFHNTQCFLNFGYQNIGKNQPGP